MEALLKEQEELQRLVTRKKKLSTGRRTGRGRKKLKALAEASLVQEGEDTFGADDRDWDVYIEMQEGDGAIDRAEQRLSEIEALLKEHGQQTQTTLSSQEQHQILFGVERIRIPEIVFQPSMIGVDQVGLGDALDQILQRFSPVERKKLLAVEILLLVYKC